MWFDSVCHSWIIKALQLGKVPEKLLNSILRLIELWTTKVNLLAEGTNTGVVQGDCLSLILFILSVNPLSFMLSLLPGYNIGKPNSKVNISYLFFVDDLKTFAENKKVTLHLDLITRITNDYINYKWH